MCLCQCQLDEKTIAITGIETLKLYFVLPSWLRGLERLMELPRMETTTTLYFQHKVLVLRGPLTKPLRERGEKISTMLSFQHKLVEV